LMNKYSGMSLEDIFFELFSNKEWHEDQSDWDLDRLPQRNDANFQSNRPDHYFTGDHDNPLFRGFRSRRRVEHRWTSRSLIWGFHHARVDHAFTYDQFP